MNYHNAYDYFLDPPHKLTVCLIGCGGTGSQVLSILGRFNRALMALGHPGLYVTVFDDDKVSEANIGRQLFSEDEIDQYKAVSLISRINRFYGTNWDAMTERFGEKPTLGYNIYISCVDDFDTRFKIANKIKNSAVGTHSKQKFYWLDFGNTNNSGQAILGTLSKCDIEMPCFDEWAARYNKPKKSVNAPSCSLAEALEKQDLLINSNLANLGMQLLWRLFREGKTPYRGVIMNLQTLTSNPILA